MLPWLSGGGGILVQNFVLWMNVCHNLTVEDDELRIMRFLPFKVIKITLFVQLMTFVWCKFEYLNYCLVMG